MPTIPVSPSPDRPSAAPVRPTTASTRRARRQRLSSAASPGKKAAAAAGATPSSSRPRPAFFRPAPEWGGKSAGYALGYADSRPRWEEEEGRSGGVVRQRGKYERDRMRKASWGEEAW
jgi:hypothetical protein